MLLQDKYLHVAAHLKVFSKTMKLVHISRLLLQLLIEPTIKHLVDGYNEGDKIANSYLFRKFL